MLLCVLFGSFAVYEWAKRILISEEQQSKLQIAAPFVAGAFARLMATTVKIPFDVVKQRLEVQGAILHKTQHNVYTGSSSSSSLSVPSLDAHSFIHSPFPSSSFSLFSGTFDAFKKIVAREGIAKGLWTGFSVTLLRDLPFSATYFTTYEMSKYYQKRILAHFGLLGDRDLNTANHLVAGATAGCFASFVTIPIDTVKTRIQTEALTLKKSKALELIDMHKHVDHIKGDLH